MKPGKLNSEEAVAAAIQRLETYANERGLDWVVSYASVLGEPAAFRLISVEPPEVIGETEEQAQGCISLAAEAHASAVKRFRRSTKP